MVTGTRVQFFKSDNEVGLQHEMNEFMKIRNVKNVSFNVSRNFLLGSTLGEFQEIWYGMVEYEV